MCIFYQISKKMMPPTYWTLFFSFKWFGIEPRQSRKMAKGIWLASYLCCSLQTEILASNSANGVFSLPPLILCMKLNAHYEWRWLRPLDWCVKSSAFNFMPETECTPFAEFEAKNWVERPQLLMWEVTGQSNGISHIHSWCFFGFRNKIRGRLNTPLA